MSEQNDGGPAYPVASTAHLDYASICGMSLRDFFAAAALPTVIHDWCESDVKFGDVVAKKCYQFADAMLAERERKS